MPDFSKGAGGFVSGSTAGNLGVWLEVIEEWGIYLVR